MSLADDARAIIDANSYLTLATADAEGRPWVSPVWFATTDRHEFFWVSDPDATHSRNIAQRPQVAAVIFDSHAPIGTGEGVCMAAVAEQLAAGDARDRAIAAFSDRSLEQGGRAWAPEDVAAPAVQRLFRAIVSEHWLVDRGAVRTPVHVIG
jgi:nitroimidazol reductase NimA-like FMN-containing flavoprotein (pyridoxamine 5'-phosphate oxidase superfamily)